MAFIFTSINNLITSYRWNVKLLEKESLETNRIYAQKLGQFIDLYLKDTQQLLKYSANEFETNIDDQEELQLLVDNFLKKDSSFSSIAVISTEGEFIAGSPKTILSEKKQNFELSSEGLKVLQQKEPYISKPLKATTGREVIMISHPLFAEDGKHIAVLAVTIYIHDENNAFSTILGTHYYDDGSYVYVIDSDGRIIYHKDPSFLDYVVPKSSFVQHVMDESSGGVNGKEVVENRDGSDMLTGYSISSLASWGIISQTPLEVAIEPAVELVFQMFLSQLPLLVIAIFIVFYFAQRIVRPLNHIATITEDSVNESDLKNLHQLNTWYYEAQQIKNALITSFSSLHNRVHYYMDQSTIDPLTNLTNRRTLDAVLEKLVDNNTSFAVAMLDIDHFKRVNDTYGHGVGDQVLQFLAQEMKVGTRQQDICCRFGGEEFTIILPETTDEIAYSVIEQLRQSIEGKVSPSGEKITFSAGIAVYPTDANTSEDLLSLADQALYKAKKNGRNQVIIYKNENESL